MIHRKKSWKILKKYAEYGIHIWAILLIANAALVYAYHFATHAAPQTASVQQTDETTVTKGPLLNVTFTVPGIASESGTTRPKRLVRNLTIFLYAPDANSLNPNVKPLYTVKGTATYQADSTALYAKFANPRFKLSNVKEGDYQIVLRTDESLRTIIKESPDSVGGQLFSLVESETPLLLPVQTMLMGDTIPKEGDNAIDVSDYNAFVNCYGAGSKSDFCQQNNYGDFDDNGAIEGVDYNILLRTFSVLIRQGQTIPQVTVSPSKTANRPTPTSAFVTPKQTTKTTIIPSKKVSPTKATDKKTTESKKSPLGGIVIALLAIVAVGVGAFFFLKKRRNNATPPDATTPPANENAVQTDTQTQPQTEQTSTAQQPTEAEAETETKTEPISSDETKTAAETPTKDDDAKSYYVKKRLPDDAKTGYWLTLTDDNGAIDAHYTTTDVTDGFAKIKGTMKTENGKKFMEITQLTPEG